jgi:hypothetical protein
MAFSTAGVATSGSWFMTCSARLTTHSWGGQNSCEVEGRGHFRLSIIAGSAAATAFLNSISSSNVMMTERKIRMTLTM